MAIPTYKRWDDLDALVLNGEIGSAYNLLKSVLTAAGWTVVWDEPSAYKIVLRNNPMTGTGCYVRIVDDGSDSSYGARIFNLVVYGDMTDIDTGTFPHAEVEFGIFLKSYYLNATPRKWIIVADDRTCYFSIYSHEGVTSSPSNASGHLHSGGFGDYESWQPGMPGSFQSTSVKNPISTTYVSLQNSFGSHRSNVALSCSIANPTVPSITYYHTSENVLGMTTASSNQNDGIGGSGRVAPQSFDIRVWSVPLIIYNSSSTILGKLRGVTGPTRDVSSFSNFGRVDVQTEGNKSFEYVYLLGGTRTPSYTTGVQYNSAIFCNLGDWDVPVGE